MRRGKSVLSVVFKDTESIKRVLEPLNAVLLAYLPFVRFNKLDSLIENRGI